MGKIPRHFLETDQLQCYSKDGQPLPCDGTGQDASFEKQARRLGQMRFQVMDHVVRDEFTGAVWTRDANPAEFPLTWQEALQFVANLCAGRAHGCGDWQLPSRRLLFSLISHQNVNPALPKGHPFEDVFTGYYWTREPCRRLPDQAWYVHLGGGRIHRGMKHGSYMVWPVSPDNAKTAVPVRSDNSRFTIDDVCAHDSHTGLVWSRDANPAGRRLAWQEALSAVHAFNSNKPGGCRDWRLPTIRELESLVDLGSHSPALPTDHPFINVQDG